MPLPLLPGSAPARPRATQANAREQDQPAEREEATRWHSPIVAIATGRRTWQDDERRSSAGDQRIQTTMSSNVTHPPFTGSAIPRRTSIAAPLRIGRELPDPVSFHAVDVAVPTISCVPPRSNPLVAPLAGGLSERSQAFIEMRPLLLAVIVFRRSKGLGVPSDAHSVQLPAPSCPPALHVAEIDGSPQAAHAAASSKVSRNTMSGSGPASTSSVPPELVPDAPEVPDTPDDEPDDAALPDAAPTGPLPEEPPFGDPDDEGAASSRTASPSAPLSTLHAPAERTKPPKRSHPRRPTRSE